jgi:hypothetical protein
MQSSKRTVQVNLKRAPNCALDNADIVRVAIRTPDRNNQQRGSPPQAAYLPTTTISSFFSAFSEKLRAKLTYE